MDERALVEAIVEERSWALTVPEEGVYLIGMPTSGGRSQQVYLVFRAEGEHQVALMWSDVASASRFSDPWQLLDYNWSHTYGALARRGESVVLKNSELVSAGDGAALGLALEHVGKTADALEAELYGELDLN